MAFFQSFQQFTGLPELIALLGIFILGALVGSFLNVVIHRVPRGESIVFPNSHCPKCGSAIRPYDNIPIISWIILGGKCRVCGESISIRYPAVELLNAVLWLGIYLYAGFSPILPVLLVFASVMIALMHIDAEHMILPNVITYPFFFFVMAARLFIPAFFGIGMFPDDTIWPSYLLLNYGQTAASLVLATFGAIAGGGSLWLVGEIWKRLRGVDAMGLGDVKMMFGVGALLGWRLTLFSIFLAAFTGAVTGISLVVIRKERNLQQQIPFGIFLGAGAIISLLFGQRFLDWYLSAF
ncbi:MAG: prepilin peptidase [Pyrinomonadaceae bacterium]|jgi:leader peptidase (prepilin peptidase)/N-methyltransferase